MYCKNCGTQISDDSTFCRECGTAISKNTKTGTSVPAINNMPQPNSAPVPKKKHKGLKIAAVIFAILFVLVIAAAVSDFDEDDVSFNSTVTTTTEKAVNKALITQSKIDKLKADGDLTGLLELCENCPEKNKDHLQDAIQSLIYREIYSHRSSIYSLDTKYITKLYGYMQKADNICTNDDTVFTKLKSAISKMKKISKNEDYYREVRDKSADCYYVIDAEVVSRVQSHDDENDYLDEYHVYADVESEYEDNGFIIRTDMKMEPGSLGHCYLKYIDTEDYTSEGFEYKLRVYEFMGDTEIQEYLEIKEEYSKLVSQRNSYLDDLPDIREIIDSYANLFSGKITADNIYGTYICGYDTLPYEYLHTLTLKEDNTFEISINYTEGMNTQTGNFTVSDSLITCKNSDVYFTLKMSDGCLVYKNMIDNGVSSIAEGEEFVK